MAKSAFKQLQQEWYQKLADSGFIDAEEFSGDDLRLKQHAHHVYSEVDDFAREIKEHYFNVIGQKVSDPETPFKNDDHRFIMTKRSEGEHIKDICEELGTLRRQAVRYIIRNYEVAWNLRTYSRRQLHRYDKKKKVPTP